MNKNCNGPTPVLRPRLRPPFLSTKDSTSNRRDHRWTSAGPIGTWIPSPVVADLAFRSIRLRGKVDLAGILVRLNPTDVHLRIRGAEIVHKIRQENRQLSPGRCNWRFFSRRLPDPASSGLLTIQGAKRWCWSIVDSSGNRGSCDLDPSNIAYLPRSQDYRLSLCKGRSRNRNRRRRHTIRRSSIRHQSSHLLRIPGYRRGMDFTRHGWLLYFGIDRVPETRQMDL